MVGERMKPSWPLETTKEVPERPRIAGEAREARHVLRRRHSDARERIDLLEPRAHWSEQPRERELRTREQICRRLERDVAVERVCLTQEIDVDIEQIGLGTNRRTASKSLDQRLQTSHVRPRTLQRRSQFLDGMQKRLRRRSLPTQRVRRRHDSAAGIAHQPLALPTHIQKRHQRFTDAVRDLVASKRPGPFNVLRSSRQHVGRPLALGSEPAQLIT
jgi:hypothetical protein